jgi:magnesium transporter
MTETDTSSGAIGGRLGSRTTRDTTFHGNDPETVAAASICQDTATRCQARTRLYKDGQLVAQGFAIEQISDHLTDSGAMVWLDLRDPDHDDLAVLQEEFGLHPVAIEDALVDRERPKIDRYRTHLFLTAYSARLNSTTGELATSEISAFILPRALITIRKDDGLDIGKVVDHWDASPDLAVNGIGYLLYGLLDYIVDGHFEAVQSLDDAVEGLEDDLFAPTAARDLHVQRRSFELRKSLVLLRRIVLPMREVLNTVMRRDLRHVNEDMTPYYQDVYDHVLRAAEWTESLRDLVTTILETNLTIQGNRMNVITKKVTSWAAIIAVPTFITGFYGMNVPYPGFSQHVGIIAAAVLMIGSGVGLYWVFRRNDWLLFPALQVLEPTLELGVGADLVLRRRHAERQRQQEGGQGDHEQHRDQEGRGRGAGDGRDAGCLGDVRGRHRPAVDVQRGHAGVVHAGDRDAHDERRADGGPHAAHPGADPQRRGARHDRDHHRERDEGQAVGHRARHGHRRHAQVVHGRHPDADDHAAGQQPWPRPGPRVDVGVADDEQANAHHRDREQHGPDGYRHVVEDRLPGDREAEHRDEVHGPDPDRADRHGGQAQPARLGEALVGPRQDHAAQAEVRAKAGHREAEQRIEQAVGEIVDGNHEAPLVTARGYGPAPSPALAAAPMAAPPCAHVRWHASRTHVQLRAQCHYCAEMFGFVPIAQLRNVGGAPGARCHHPVGGQGTPPGQPAVPGRW